MSRDGGSSYEPDHSLLRNCGGREIDRPDVGSLSAAARRPGVVKSALSHPVAALERDGGAKVIHRLRRGAVLTAVGEILAAHGRAIVSARQT